jgi:hypothetical protein
VNFQFQVFRYFFLMMAITASGHLSAQSARALFSTDSGTKISSQSTEKKPEKNATQKTSYAGLQYTIFQRLDQDKTVKVSPSKKFKSGDQIKVIVTSNKKGILTAINISSDGEISVLSEQSLKAGAEVTVPSKGFLKFVGKTGVEQLIFVLSEAPFSKQKQVNNNIVESLSEACGSKNVAARGLVVDDAAGNQFSVLDNSGKCSMASASTRSLVVEVEEDSGYGVLPVGDLNSGALLTLKLKLVHE